MREKDIERYSKDLARRQGWWVRKFTSPGHRSAPDDIFAKHGRVFWVEFKATGEKPTPLQEEEHAKMRMAGLTVYWTDCREGFKLILDDENAAPLYGFEGYGVIFDRSGVLRFIAAPCWLAKVSPIYK